MIVGFPNFSGGVWTGALRVKQVFFYTVFFSNLSWVTPILESMFNYVIVISLHPWYRMQFGVENHTITVCFFWSSRFVSQKNLLIISVVEYSIDFDLVFLFLWFQFILDLPREYKDHGREKNSNHMRDVTSWIVPIPNNPLVSRNSFEVLFITECVVTFRQVNNCLRRSRRHLSQWVIVGILCF